MITHIINEVVNLITATSPAAEIAHNPRDARRALNARRPAIWVPPPTRIKYETATVLEAEFTITVLSPKSNPIDALDHAATIAHTLSDAIFIDALEPDIYTIDGGEPVPGVGASFTVTMENPQ